MQYLILAATAGILVAGWLNGGPRVAENMLLPTIVSSFGWHKLGRRKRDGTWYDQGFL